MGSGCRSAPTPQFNQDVFNPVVGLIFDYAARTAAGSREISRVGHVEVETVKTVRLVGFSVDNGERTCSATRGHLC